MLGVRSATRGAGCSQFRRLLITLISLVSVSSALRLVSAGDGYKDAYEQLVEYGFPTGLLPNTVTGYTLEDDGKFAVFLQDKCNVYIPGEFPVTYSKTITGVLSYGSLKNLNGISVKAYYFWWSINAITVVNGNLVFEVGLLTAKYPVDNFEESPGCATKSMVELFLDE
ncbi:hypothetical protein MPTK1_1g07370 [Marchantia polymorpha subsp. ruderalis]|uniref:DUF538 domain-containing protein n=2 Tax=Marchantia polymorpha TaxID=3197 RepID=A0AAF6AMJ3_MARPO|nr:hypothetical protein MARPO_0043s0130 [Marchantia polymorpha]BBM97663.1 hypothetical protein Mp_1g07370 [Marchantia polymorpha subsp. ruderalis]|eukprot:PTQ39905.1 hypothetical protein MARPO_0043s0130 [Marchantia polymorpha]